MKKVLFGLALLMVSMTGHAGVTSPSVSISSSASGQGAWIVIDGEVYLCVAGDGNKVCTHFVLPEANGATWTGKMGN
jgi:hypothetical protein